MSSIPVHYQEGIWSITPHTIDADFPEGRQIFEVQEIEYIKLQSVMENGHVVCNAFIKAKIDTNAHFIGCYTEEQGTMCHVLAQFAQTNHIQMLTGQEKTSQKTSDDFELISRIKNIFDPANPQFKKTMIILGALAFLVFAGSTGMLKAIKLESISGPGVVIIYFLLRFFRNKSGENKEQKFQSDHLTKKTHSWMPSRNEEEDIGKNHRRDLIGKAEDKSDDQTENSESNQKDSDHSDVNDTHE